MDSLFIMTPTDIVIVTNGVSFSLVAGAVCIVYFSKNLTENNTTGKDRTLNINSTGAKSLTVRNAVLNDRTNVYGYPGTYIVSYTGSAYAMSTAPHYSYSDDN